MTNLTDKQIELLYEMSEIHFQWFHKYSPETATYEDVIELNHLKMISIIEGCNDCSEEMVQFIFESIIEDYKMMLKDYGG